MRGKGRNVHKSYPMKLADPFIGNKYYVSDASFQNLMNKRIYNVLLISSAYDSFMLEEDGRVEEQLFNEYVSLNLRFPPRIIQETSEKRAFERLKEISIDLVIVMPNANDNSSFSLATKIKQQYDQIPIVVLTPFSRKVSLEVSKEDLSSIDYIFSWLGNADILLVIIKLIEDIKNVEHDVNEMGVQSILLVEDSIRFYSSLLPHIYKIVFKQSLEFMSEGLNEHQKMLRMRGRPKVLLARNFEEAMAYFDKYKNNLLGVITDMEFSRNGEMDTEAGLKLIDKIKSINHLLPVLLQSSNSQNTRIAKKMRVGFVNKNSKTFSIEIKRFITKYLAFGDFEFINPYSHLAIKRVPNLKSLQKEIFSIPEESLKYHLRRHHLSKWLKARALFSLAHALSNYELEDFEDMDEVRQFVFDAIGRYRFYRSKGVIAKFYPEQYDEYYAFSRIGEGSLGGKARGLAFLDSMIKRNYISRKFDNVLVTIPRTVVVSTDVFDQFMEINDLYEIALNSDADDEEILEQFLSGNLPDRIVNDLRKFVHFSEKPIAIRSSSLLEDSHYQPFAGIYSTYMIPVCKNSEVTLDMLIKSIKAVYASAYFTTSKSYMKATSNVIDEEKMAIVLQEVCGKDYGGKFYPHISGVARSINFYPIPPEKPEDGVASIALGLGKYVVEGGLSLRFSPKYPQKILQLSSPSSALSQTQKIFYALDTTNDSFRISVDNSLNLLKLRIKDAENDQSLKHLVSTFDFQNNMLRNGMMTEGKRILTFSNILEHGHFPLAQIISEILSVGQKEMNLPVEIEFAVQLNSNEHAPSVFNVLQIRPIVGSVESSNVAIKNVKESDCIITSGSALGNGIIENIHDFIYIKTEHFDAANNEKLVPVIDQLNQQLKEENHNYILMGPGRWGSSDYWLGIPVRWNNISEARVIIESGLENYRIDPSQGTHFFQNLTSFGVGYFTINPYNNDGYIDWDFLNQHASIFENEWIRHVRFAKPVVIKIDGKHNKAVILKPKHTEQI